MTLDTHEQVEKLDKVIESIAYICHEVNRAYCEATGDLSQPTWENAEHWQSESAIAGVKAVIKRLENDEPVTPEASHLNWSAHKESEGWKYGPVKDTAKKEHPCLVPYEELPAEQRIKDHLFIAVVKACF